MTLMVLIGVFMVYIAWWIPHYHQEWFEPLQSS